MWLSPRTKGSGDPSSGCICNTAGPQSVSVNLTLLGWMLWAVVTSIVACAGSHTYHRLNNGDIDRASAAGSGHRNGSLRRHGKFNETAVSSCSKRPLSSQLDHRLWKADRVLHPGPVSNLHPTSGVCPGVDGQILGYPPQDLLLGLSPILTLQQLFVRVGQVELHRTTPHITPAIYQQDRL